MAHDACLAPSAASFAPSSTLRLRQHHASPSPALPPLDSHRPPPRLTPAAFSLLLLLLCSLFSFYISSTLNPFHFHLSSSLPKPFISCTDSSLPSLWTPPENPFTHLSLSSSPDHPFPNLFLQSLGVGGRELNGVRNEVRNARRKRVGSRGPGNRRPNRRVNQQPNRHALQLPERLRERLPRLF